MLSFSLSDVLPSRTLPVLQNYNSRKLSISFLKRSARLTSQRRGDNFEGETLAEHFLQKGTAMIRPLLWVNGYDNNIKTEIL